jgi:hypothetical protein
MSNLFSSGEPGERRRQKEDPSDPNYTPDPGPVAAPPVTDPTSGGGGSGGSGGPTLPPFNWTPPPYTGPTAPNYGPAPVFDAPRFNMPDFSHMTEDPSYQFRLNQGEEALNASAAAKGMLRTGGTLKDILDYGQNSASQEAGNIFNRAIQSYTQNYNAARDEFAPRMAEYQARVGGANLGFGRAWDAYTFPISEERAREQMILDAWARAVGSLGQ